MEEGPHLTVNHRDHASVWQLSDSALLSCLACVVEQMDDENSLTGRKKIIIGQLLNLMNSPSLATHSVGILNRDVRVTTHFISVLTTSLSDQDETLVSLCAEVIMQCIHLVRNEQIVCCVLDCISQKCLKLCNLSRSVAMLNVVGRLLHDLPALSTHFVKGYASLVDYTCAGMSYPDPEVQASVAYIYLHLYAPPGGAILPAGVSERVGGALLQLLATRAQPQYLQINALGLLKVMLEDTHLADLLDGLSERADGPSVTAALKRALLSKEDLLQVAGAACLTAMLVHTHRGQHFTDKLLQADMAEFLFEVLASTNELLIGSVFSSLLIFVNSEQFFQRCHAVYGIESLMRAVEQVLKGKSADIIKKGITLLKIFIDRQPDTFRLFSHMGQVEQCLKLIRHAVEDTNFEVSITAINAFSLLLRSDHLLVPVPLGIIQGTLEVIVKLTQVIPRMKARPSSLKRNTRNKGENKVAKARTTQDRLHAYLQAFHDTCLLARKLKSKPDLTSLVAPPSIEVNEDRDGEGQEENPLSGLVRLLITSLQTSIIPSVMANVQLIELSEIFEYVFASINVLLSVDASRTQRLTCHLAENGFINVCLHISKDHGDGVKSEVDRLLTRLYVIGLQQANIITNSDLAEVENLFLSGMNGLKGDANELLYMLRQNSAQPADSHLSAAQCAAISLLYTSFILGHRDIVPIPDLREALGCYLDFHQEILGHLPAFILQQLTTLTAMSCVAGCECVGGQALSSVLVKKSEAVRKLWSASPHLPPSLLLRWSFSHQDINSLLPQRLVKTWLENEDGGSLDEIVEVALEEKTCLRTLMDYLSVCDGAHLPRLASVFTQIINSKRESRSDVLEFLHQSVPSKLQETLLNESSLQTPLICLMDLLVQLIQEDYRTTSTEVHIKIAYHVTSIACGRQDEGAFMEPTQMAALRLLASLLLLAHNQGDQRVAGVMLSRAGFLQVIERGVRGRWSVGTSSSLLSLLLLHQAKQRLAFAYTIKLEEECLLSLSFTAGPVEKWSVLQLWSAYLTSMCQKNDSGDNPPILLALSPSTEHECEGDTSKMKMDVTSHSLRSIFIICLQAALQNISWILEAAAGCLKAIFVYAKKIDLTEHLLRQPWIGILLQAARSDTTGGALTPLILTLCIKLIEYDVSEHRDLVNQLLVRHFREIKDVSSVRVEPGFVDAMEKVLTHTPVPGGDSSLDLEAWSVRQRVSGARTDLSSITRPLLVGEDVIFIQENTD